MERVPRTGAGQCCAPIALHPDTSGGSGLPLVRARMYRFPVGRQEVFFPFILRRHLPVWVVFIWGSCTPPMPMQHIIGGGRGCGAP